MNGFAQRWYENGGSGIAQASCHANPCLDIELELTADWLLPCSTGIVSDSVWY